MKLTIGDSIEKLDFVVLNPGDSVVLPPKKIHRMYGNEDTYYLEASTTELHDVIRIEDDDQN